MATLLLDNFNTGTAGAMLAAAALAAGGMWETHLAFNPNSAVYASGGRVRPNVAGNTNAAKVVMMNSVTMPVDGMVTGTLFIGANLSAFDTMMLAARVDPVAATAIVGGIQNNQYFIGQFSGSTALAQLTPPVTAGTLANTRASGDRLRLEYNGEWVGLFVNELLILEGTTTVLTAGRSGFLCQTNTAISGTESVNAANGLQLDIIEQHDLPAQNVAVNDPFLYLADYVWDVDAGNFAECSHPGAYGKVRTDHPEVYVNVDASMFTAAGKTGVTYRWTWDDAIWQQATINRGQTRLAIHPPAGGGFRDLKIGVVGLPTVNFWGTGGAPGQSRAKVMGLSASGGTGLAAPAVFPDCILAFGDSMASGLYSGQALNIITNNGFVQNGTQDGDRGWPMILAAALGVEVGVIGNESQGITVGGIGAVPNFQQAWNFHRNSRPRSFSKVPKAVIICHGVNDKGATDSAVTNGVTAVATAMRGAGGVGTETPVLWVASPAGHKASAVQAGVTAAGDAFTRFANVSSLFTKVVATGNPDVNKPSLYFADLIHLNSYGVAIFVAKIIAALSRFPAANLVASGSRYGAYGTDQTGSASTGGGGGGNVVSVKGAQRPMNFIQPSANLAAVSLDATTPVKIFAARENGNGGWRCVNNTGQVVFFLETRVGETPNAAIVKAAGQKYADGDAAQGSSTVGDVWAIMASGSGSVYPQQLSRAI